MVQNADPSNPDTFRSCCQPQILNGTTGTVQIRITHCGTTQHIPTAPLTAAGHANIDRRFHDPFKLQASIKGRAAAPILYGRLGVRLLEKLFYGTLRGALSNDDKIPRLHEPHRPGVMRGGQNPCKHIVSDRLLHKVPTDIPPLENHAVDGRPFVIGKSSIATLDVSLPTHVCYSGISSRWRS